MFNIQINGEPFHCINSVSIETMIAYLGIDTQFSLIEYNSEIVHEDQWTQIMLQPRDKLEIITIVGGG